MNGTITAITAVAMNTIHTRPFSENAISAGPIAAVGFSASRPSSTAPRLRLRRKTTTATAVATATSAPAWPLRALTSNGSQQTIAATMAIRHGQLWKLDATRYASTAVHSAVSTRQASKAVSRSSSVSGDIAKAKAGAYG